MRASSSSTAPEPEPELSGDERAELLRLARAAIAARLERDPAPDPPQGGLSRSPALERRAGVFVTLKLRGEVPRLRGCIGKLEPASPLARAVVEMAERAAFDDPRFPPLGGDELDRIAISVSVLGRQRRVDDWRSIRLGAHGVRLVRGPHQGVFLPQVATEQRWDRRQLLENLALKAGLERDGWTDAEIYVFETQSFGEPETPGSAPGGR